MIGRFEKKRKVGCRLAAGVLIYLVGGFPTLAFALPQGGQVVYGAASIDQPTAQDMVVNQSTGELIVNWQSFNIGAAESVQFVQPSSSSIALNRVIGADPSQILGRLSANGQVFVSNGSGVIFGPDSRVDTHGLLATTLKITDQDFINGQYRFAQDSSKPLAGIINEGVIQSTGYAGLLAPAVENRGTIVASLGSVTLASGRAAVLDFQGDGLVNFVLTEAVSGDVTDASGNPLADRVRNSGTIRADGGQVTLAAKDAGDMIRNVVNQQGVVEARSVVERDGRIFLSGGEHGVVRVEGSLDVSGRGSGERGGRIEITGEKVGLFETARLDASGDTGGGTVLVGGDFQGKNPEVANAYRTYVAQGASVLADSLTAGDGGKVIVWADDVTRFYGSISVRGGSLSGNGGFVEVSGKESLNYDGSIDAASVNGVAGAVLFDPKNITISNGGVDVLASNDAFSENSSSSVTFDADNITALTNVGTAVTLQANNDITITEAITTNNTGGAGGDLTLQAGRSVVINANITTDDGTLDIKANAPASDGVVNAQRDTGSANIFMADGVTLNGGSGNVTLFLDEGTGLANSTAGTVSVESITTTGHVKIANEGDTSGASITRSSSDSLITASSVAFILANDIGDGTIGTSSNPMRVTVSNLDAVSLEGSGGIFIESPTQGLTLGGSNLIGSTTGLKTTTSGSIVLTAAGSLVNSGTGGTISSAGALSLSATAGITLENNVTAEGASTFDADSDDNGSGSFTNSTNSISISTGNNSLSITASDLVISGATTTINVGTGSLALKPSTAASIGLGNGTGTFSISSSEIGKITSTGGVTIGDSALASAITTDDFNAGSLSLSLETAGTIDDADVGPDNLVTTGSLSLLSGGAIGGGGAININTSAVTVTGTGGNSIHLSNNSSAGDSSYSLITGGAGNVQIDEVNNNLLFSTLTTTGNVSLNSSAGNISGSGFTIGGTAAFANSTSNKTITLSTGTSGISGQVTFTTTGSLADVNYNNGTGGINISSSSSLGGKLFINSSNSLILSNAIQLASAGSNVTVNVTGGNDLAVNAAITTGAGDIILKADGNISFSAAGDLTTTTGDIDVSADNDNSGAGTLTMVSGTVFHNTTTLTGNTALTSAGNMTLYDITTNSLTLESRTGSITTNAPLAMDGSMHSASGAGTTVGGTITTNDPINIVTDTVSTSTSGLTVNAAVNSTGHSINGAGYDVDLNASVTASGSSIAFAVREAIHNINGTALSFVTADSLGISSGGTIATDATISSGQSAGINQMFMRANGSITFDHAVAFKTLTMDASGGVSLNANVTTTGDFIARADSDRDGNGIFSQASGTTLTSTNGSIFINGSQIFLSGNRSAPNGSINITDQPLSAGQEAVIKQAIESTFLTEFLESSQTGC